MRGKKHVILWIAILSFMMLLGGCGDNESNKKTESESQGQSELETSTDMTEEDTELREVVFLNYVVDQDRNDQVICSNELISHYQVEDDADTLYAFCVIDSRPINDVYPEDYSVQETLKKAGFVILSDYPGNRIAFAGTMDKFEYYFKETCSLDGWYFCVMSAVRPDMEEIMVKAGWNDYKDRVEWFNNHFDELIPLLGTEEKQVTMEVPVVQ